MQTFMTNADGFLTLPLLARHSDDNEHLAFQAVQVAGKPWSAHNKSLTVKFSKALIELFPQEDTIQFS